MHWVLVIPILLLVPPYLRAQTAMTLAETSEKAIAHYPSIRVSNEELGAAAAQINLARTAFLPRADFIAQVNRATRNNVFGLLFPQSILPSISGPPNPVNSMTSVWGSATGFLVSWEPFDFGLRQANVDFAEAARKRAGAAVERTRFEVAVLAADAYLTSIAARQAYRAAEAHAQRARTVEQIVGALTKAELRPGADLSRSRAETASAEAQLVQAANAISAARTTLQQLTGVEVAAEPGRLLATMPDDPKEASVAASPYAVEQAAAVTAVEAERKVLDRAYYPRFNLQGATYARGTGANPDGTTLGGLNGLGPNIANWAVGMTVTFPILELPSLKARKEIADHRRAAESAKYDQVLVELNARVRKAKDDMASARRVAELTPRQLEAAQASEQQATARYRAGLGTLVEVADAQRLLTQAEIDNSLARLNVWRAALAVAAAEGDLTPFFNQVK
jgi:outer membrane protein TolC